MGSLVNNTRSVSVGRFTGGSKCAYACECAAGARCTAAGAVWGARGGTSSWRAARTSSSGRAAPWARRAAARRGSDARAPARTDRLSAPQLERTGSAPGAHRERAGESRVARVASGEWRTSCSPAVRGAVCASALLPATSACKPELPVQPPPATRSPVARPSETTGQQNHRYAKVPTWSARRQTRRPLQLRCGWAERKANAARTPACLQAQHMWRRSRATSSSRARSPAGRGSCSRAHESRSTAMSSTKLAT